MLFKSDSTVQPPLHQHITSPFFIFLSCLHKNKKNEEAPKVRKEHGSVGRNMEVLGDTGSSGQSSSHQTSIYGGEERRAQAWRDLCVFCQFKVSKDQLRP